MTEDQLPSTFRYDASSDFEDMDTEDFITPRLKLAQAQTPEVLEGKVNAGDIFSQATGNAIIERGKSKDIIPLVWWKEYIEWNPNRSDKKQRILNRSTDSQSELEKICKRRETVTNSDGKVVPRVQNAYNVLMLVPEISWTDMFLMSFSRTHFKVWKSMLNLTRGLKHDPDGAGMRQCPLFGASYPLSAFLDGDDTNRWFIPSFGNPEMLQLGHLQAIAPTVTELKSNIDAMKAANSSAEDEKPDHDADSSIDESAMGSI